MAEACERGHQSTPSLFETPAPGLEADAARFPLFVDLRGVRCLVVGAGGVGRRRAEGLARFGALVDVCDPALGKGQDTPWPEGCRLLARPWEPGEERAYALVCASTDDERINDALARSCHEARIPVTVSHDHARCTFYFPALCESEHLCAGVVSHGSDHHLTAIAAKGVRRALKAADEAKEG